MVYHQTQASFLICIYIDLPFTAQEGLWICRSSGVNDAAVFAFLHIMPDLFVDSHIYVHVMQSFVSNTSQHGITLAVSTVRCEAATFWIVALVNFPKCIEFA